MRYATCAIWGVGYQTQHRNQLCRLLGDSPAIQVQAAACALRWPAGNLGESVLEQGSLSSGCGLAHIDDVPIIRVSLR